MSTYNKQPTRFPNGSTNVKVKDVFGYFPSIDRSKYIEYMNDFQRPADIAAGDWTTTKVGLGTIAIADVVGGEALFTTTAGATDSLELQAINLPFKLVAGKKFCFKTRFKLGDVSASTAAVGVQIVNTNPVAAASDGVFFKKASGAATVNFITQIGSVATTQAAIATMVAATMMEFGFFYDGKSELQYWVDGVRGLELPVTNIPTAVITPVIYLLNAAAAAKTLNIDYLYIAAER